MSSFNGVDVGTAPMENAIYVKMDSVEDPLGKKIYRDKKDEKGTRNVTGEPLDNRVSNEQMSSMDLEVEDMNKLSGRSEGGLNEGWEDEEEEVVVVLRGR